MSPRKPSDVSQVPTGVGPLWVDRWDRGISKKLRSQGEYEPETTRWLTRATRPGMCIVDVGANIGYYTVLFAQAVGDGGRVLAFEPDPWNRELLERNVRDNGLAGRVSIDPAAVTDYEGTCRLHIDDTYWGVHSLSAANLRSAERSAAVDVPATTLDAAVARARFERIDILKIDAQGAEGRILRGAAATMAGDRTETVLLELWPLGLENCGSSVGEVIGKLRDWGFQPATLHRKTADLLPCSWSDVEAQASQLAGHGSVNLVLTKR